jgi:hypothetical protein
MREALWPSGVGRFDDEFWPSGVQCGQPRRINCGIASQRKRECYLGQSLILLTFSAFGKTFVAQVGLYGNVSIQAQ